MSNEEILYGHAQSPMLRERSQIPIHTHSDNHATHSGLSLVILIQPRALQEAKKIKKLCSHIRYLWRGSGESKNPIISELKGFAGTESFHFCGHVET